MRILRVRRKIRGRDGDACMRALKWDYSPLLATPRFLPRSSCSLVVSLSSPSFYQPSSKKAAYSCNFRPVPLRICLFVLVLVSLTHSQLKRHVSPIFDRFGLLVFRDNHLRVLHKGIDILSKGPSLPSLCIDTTHTPLSHCNYCTCHNRGLFRSFFQSDSTSSVDIGQPFR